MSQILEDFNRLHDAQWESEVNTVYTEMGHYANVIGSSPPTSTPTIGPMPMFERYPGFEVVLAEGTRWAGPEDLGDGVLGDLRRALLARFGATMVRLDFNGDGRPDLLLLGAVVRNGVLGNLLLRNDGAGRFTDVTGPAKLANVPAAFGCSVADFDNDGRPDLVLTGPTGLRLLRNVDGARFEDVTAEAGLDKITGVCLGALWVDLDQDGDLDLVVARYAASPEAALAQLQGKGPGEGGGLLVYLNVGEARPIPPGGQALGLTCRFRPVDETDGTKALRFQVPIATLAAVDLDNDKAVDLLVLPEGQGPVALLNDRLLRFRRDPGLSAPAADWNGALVLDVNHDEQSDLLLLPAGRTPLLLLSKRDTLSAGLDGRFVAGATDSPPLRQGQAVDLDLDGWTDVVGLAQNGELVVLQNDGTGRLVRRSDVLPGGSGITDLLAVAAVDIAGQQRPDLLLWTKAGLQAWRSLDNGNHGLRLELTGRRDKSPFVRTNADGVGARVQVLNGQFQTSVENTTLSAGLGQSRLPLILGLGKANRADVVRIRWPDGVPQAELEQPAGELVRIGEVNRKITSCPVLLTWNGTRFVFITDFLGAGSMGEMAADGSTRPPRPEESVKIEAGQLVPRSDGRYVLKIAEPMDEVLYLDHLRLDVLDHPDNVDVFPDERFATAEPQPTQELLAFRERIFPVQAVDHRGRDVTTVLRQRDGQMVDGFARRSWLGFAEEHFVELDFGDRLATLRADERLFLVLAGWTDYPYPESIFAAEQAGIPMLAPTLEKRRPDGTWQSLGEIGMPAGLPRVMTVPVSGLAGARSCRLRLRTNVQIYWDQIYLAPAVPPADSGLRIRPLEIEKASLVHRGFMREVPVGKGPLITYDDDRTEAVSVSRWQGRLTRTGDVTELLRQADDRLVISGPGDEITVTFDASRLPAVPQGYVRSFVLRARGYSKDVSPFTQTGGRVEPLPFRDMKSYPYHPATAPRGAAEQDRQLWHTRPAGGVGR